MTKKLLGLPGCESCESIKKITKGKVQTISVGTKKGFAIAEKLKINKYPHCIDIKKRGKKKIIVKCDTNKFLKKFNIKLD